MGARQMTNDKWTVRGVQPETLQRVCELRDEFGATTGALIDQAVEMLYLHLCKTGQMKSISNLASDYSGRPSDLRKQDLMLWRASK